MQNPEIIPSHLPSTNPLLFSFLAILSATKLPYNFGGSDEMLTSIKSPTFAYAVNTETVDSLVRAKGLVTMSITAVIWDHKPKIATGSRIWKWFPNKKKIKQFDVSWKAEFERWRKETRDNLLLIVRMLTIVDDVRSKSDRRTTLASIYKWELEGDITIKYATKEDATGLHGMVAFFDLSVPYSVCCQIPNDLNGNEDLSKIGKKFLEDKGFDFSDCC